MKIRTKKGIIILVSRIKNDPEILYVSIEINPVDTSGIATKKRGILIKSRSELEQISNIMTNAKIVQLATSIDEVNPEKKTKPLSSETDVYEI